MTEYVHSVTLDREACRGCITCVKRCPTEAIRVRDGKAQILAERCIDCGGEPQTTNNRMELLGAIEALRALKEPCEVDLYTDSQYLVNAVSKGWLASWKARGWKRKDGALKNPDLWQELDGLLSVHSVCFHWVRGHADNEWNNRCDTLAVREREKFA